MGNAASAKPGEQFAEAVSRMHCIFRDCDDEFRALSSAANTHGKQSEQFKAAGALLASCQERRTREFAIMERACGPPQEEYKLCTQQSENASGREHQCLPLLHMYLDCAERALKQERELQMAQNYRT